MFDDNIGISATQCFLRYLEYPDNDDCHLVKFSKLNFFCCWNLNGIRNPYKSLDFRCLVLCILISKKFLMNIQLLGVNQLLGVTPKQTFFFMRLTWASRVHDEKGTLAGRNTQELGQVTWLSSHFKTKQVKGQMNPVSGCPLFGWLLYVQHKGNC